MRLLRTAVAVVCALVTLAVGAQQQVINTGTGPATGTGDPGYTAFTKVNNNFSQLFAAVYPMPKGLLYGNGSSLTQAYSSNVISLFTGTCSSSTFLRGDGSCATAGLSGSLIPSTASFSASGCSNSSLVGGANTTALIAAGSFTAGASGTCTVVLTLPTSSHGWACSASDVTLQVNFVQTAQTASSCTVSSAAVTGDVVTFMAVGY